MATRLFRLLALVLFVVARPQATVAADSAVANSVSPSERVTLLSLTCLQEWHGTSVHENPGTNRASSTSLLPDSRYQRRMPALHPPAAPQC